MAHLIASDGCWVNPRYGNYHGLLRSTAWTLITLIGASRPREGFDSNCLIFAYRRASGALTQLPMEWRGAHTRFDGSRWRISTVEPGEGRVVYCEHPWSKMMTKRMIVPLVKSRLDAGDEPTALVDPVCEIIDARADSVLFQNDRVAALGIVSETKGDGLSRYLSAVEAGMVTLIDRSDGSVWNSRRINDHEATIKERIESAVKKLSI